MRRVPSDVLTDPAYAVPCDHGDTGMAWVRGHVVRFCDGTTHQRRRELVERLVEQVTDAPFTGSPARTLLTALGLPVELEPDVATASAAYQPHAPQSPAADAAADRLVAAADGRTEAAAARVCVLVQAEAACGALAERLRAGDGAPPLPATRRVAPDGDVVEVDLVDAHFGRGAHRCPGEQLGTRLAQQANATMGE